MNSDFIKYLLFHYFRYTKQVSVIASECGMFSSDILLKQKSNLFEIEIKTSLSDFKADFKKPKHELYLGKAIPECFKTKVFKKDNNGNYLRDEDNKYILEKIALHPRYEKMIPNMFSFAVPESLIPKVETIINENYPDYGIYAILENNRLRAINRVRVYKKPKMLHKKKIDSYAVNVIVKRMSSEIATLRQNLILLEKKL